jgi:hypothetical protein
MEKLKYPNRSEQENQLIMANSLLEWIEMILNGEELADFALSFPIVRRVNDLKKGEIRCHTTTIKN